MKKIILLLAVITLTVYFNSLSHSFVWDDHLTIENNDLITHVKYIPKIFVTDLYHSHVEKFGLDHSNYYRPVQAVSFLIDYHIWKLNPFGFHLTNVLLHFANGVLVFFTIFFLCKSRMASLLTSILFLVHPVHTGAVNYLTGRSDILACFFLLLSFIAYVGRYSIAPEEKLVKKDDEPDSVHNVIARKKRALYPISVAMYILALLSKASVIIFPLVLALHDLTYGKRVSVDRGGSNRLSRFRKLRPYLLVSAVYITLRLTIFDFSPKNDVFSNISTVSAQLLTMCRTVMDYIGLLLYPADLHMERAIPLARSIFDMNSVFSILGLAFIIFLAVAAYKRSRAIFFGIAWFLTFLIPFSNIVPLSAQMAEHWLYIPSIGFLMIISVMLLRLQSLKIDLKFAIAFFAVIVSLYSFRTFMRNRDWKDDLSIYSATLKSSPKKAKMYYNIGTIYEKNKDFEKALTYYNYALNSGPEKAEIYTNIATASMSIEDYGIAEKNFKKALEIDPEHPFAHNGLGWLYEKKGKEDEALAEYKKAVTLLPGFYEAHANLGFLFDKRDMFDDAIYHFEKALSIRRNGSSCSNLSKAYYNAGYIEKSAAILREVN
ncbi:MAG: tetratricopeptide repeat protein [Candidatus Omnitrophica bacterium]|nr:tetratricopeptide repeat protein [Candidatus Omnitrophota bacterium]